MATNVKKAKEDCGYEERPFQEMCSNCGAFSSEMILPAWMIERNKTIEEAKLKYVEIYTVEKNGVEKNLQCADHGFAVKRTSRCAKWRPAETELS